MVSVIKVDSEVVVIARLVVVDWVVDVEVVVMVVVERDVYMYYTCLFYFCYLQVFIFSSFLLEN